MVKERKKFFMLWIFRFINVLVFFILVFSTSTAAASFIDIAGSKNETAIQYLYNHGIVSGYSNNTFRSKNFINRAELVKILLTSNNVVLSSNQYGNCFSDVKNQWFAPYVCYAKLKGWVQGYSDNTFHPQKYVNKAEAIKMLAYFQNYTLPQSVKVKLFDDTNSQLWYAPALYVARQKGLLEQESGSYGIGSFITRAEMSENIYRALVIQNLNLQNFSQYQPNIQNTLQSQLLRNDSWANEILSTSQVLDLKNSQLYSYENEKYIRTLTSKLFFGFHMLGYQDNFGSWKSSELMIFLLHHFQREHSIPLSTVVDRKTLLKFDQEVFNKEKSISGYAKKMGSVFQSIFPPVLKTNVSADYIAWIFLHPLEVLPQHLTQELSPSNYFMCVHIQCVGSVQKADGSMYSIVDTQTYSRGGFLFLPDIFPNDPSDPKVSLTLQKSTSMAAVMIHEFAHYLDRYDYSSEPRLNRYFIDTAEFKQISFFLEDSKYYKWCARRKNNDRKAFITKYGFDGANLIPCKDFGSQYGAPNEDFADSFTAYVMAGKTFREFSQQNSDLKKKYEWLKEKVFRGQEYDTDFAYGQSYSYFGCKDAHDTDLSGGPFYLSCNNNFIWYGEIPLKM